MTEGDSMTKLFPVDHFGTDPDECSKYIDWQFIYGEQNNLYEVEIIFDL
jgi:hypothetical protein